MVTTTSFPATTMGVLYTAAIQVTGGTGAVTFALPAGSLPPGMKLSYAVMLALIVNVCITAITSLSSRANQTFTSVSKTIAGTGSSPAKVLRPKCLPVW
jgi:hypothetical protein